MTPFTAILSALAALLSLSTTPSNLPSLAECPAMVACYADPNCGSDTDMERIADECGWSVDDDDTDAE